MAARKLKPAESEKPQNDQPAGDTSYRNGVPEAGWYKMPDAWWRDLPRLQRGLYQRMLIEYVWGTSVPRSKKAAMPEKSPWLSYVEMAAVFRCSPEQVRDDARDAAKRGLITLEQDARKGCRIGISWERWPNLKDYTAPRPVAVPEKPQKQVRWLSRAVAVEPGATFDLPKLDFAVERISLRNTSAEGTIKIGAGSCEGGVLVLETNAELVSKESRVSVKKQASQRECTPQFSFSSPLLKTCADFGIVDQSAVADIVNSCRKFAPSCTEEEILSRILLVGTSASRNRAVRNVGGLIRTQVPKYFGSPAYAPQKAKPPVRASALCGRCHDTGVVGLKAEELSFADVRRELQEGSELCDCVSSRVWRELLA